MRIGVIVLVVLMTFILPLVSSSIFIEPLRPIYNYGDQLTAQTKIVPSIFSSGHYIVNLKCGANTTINVFNNFFDLPANIERPVTITTQVLNPLIENITSSCLLIASYSGEFVNSNSFTLSKKINVDADLEFDNLIPGKTLSVSGTAMKESGVSVNGFAELFVNSLNLYKSTSVVNGLFNINLTLPSDSKSGKHNVTVELHNTDYSSKKINFGSFSDTFTVSQVLKQIEIVVNDENVKPNTDFVFQVDAFDQANDPIAREVSVVVNGPKGVPFMKKVIKSGEPQTLKFLFNDTPGYWSIETSIEGMSKRKLFYLTEIQKMQTSLINDTLIVTNVGNSPYNGPLEITIGSHVEVKQIKLNVGETQKFTLHAPDGDYTVSISDGAASESLGNTFLTGNAIKVTDLREDVIGTITNPIIWWLAIILLVLVIILVQIKLRMQKHSSLASSGMMVKPMRNDTFDLPKKEIKDTSSNSSVNNSPWFPKSTPAKTDFTSVKPFVAPSFAPAQTKVTPSGLFGNNNQGIREHAVAIALYIQGGSNTNQTLNSALSIAQESGAKIYVDGEFRIILFSPRLSHNLNNESVAVNVARRIQALFLEHARDYNESLLFGIGISDGEIISEIENGKFHFTSTGNLISFAKRIAQSSNMRLFVSDSVRRKVVTTVKTDKSPFQGIWEVTRVIDHSESRDFIKRFSDRNN